MMEEEKKDEMSFAELFESHPETPVRGFRPGDRVAGVVVKITKDTVFVDLGGKSEGMVGIEEFMDKEGNLTVSKGDRLDLRIASVREGILLSKGIKVQGAEALELLREAQQNQIPVEGRVAAVIKGGYEIDLSGVRAFCPFSQMDLQFCDRPEEHVGARYPFRITEVTERGRNVLVSRRIILQEEQERRFQELRERIVPGAEFEGKVTKLMEFGAFVDIGGMEGMVHVSEISHARINQPADVLEVGQTVKVKVLGVEPGKKGRLKIALSVKALEPDAWEKGLPIKEGEVISGRISRLTDFGAFVEVAPGVDGLVPVSEISFDRVPHPNKFLKEGETVDALVLRIDQEKRRISLSIKEAAIQKRFAEDREASPKVRLEVGQILRGIVEETKAYGLFVRLPQLGREVRGLLHKEDLLDADRTDVKKRFPRGREIDVEIVAIDEKGRIRLSQRIIQEREDRKEVESYLDQRDKDRTLGTWGELFEGIKLKEG